ncbi:MAG TPA: hypothetical protein VK507_05485 [Iamia sp.]|nr:hypothetical protein [Iamia sp.]
MEVVVGPVAATSIGAWVSFARRLLHSAGPGADVPSDAAASFDTYLDDWEALAGAGGDVTWETELEAELAEYLVYAFYRVAKDVNEEAGKAPVVPDAAAPFYWLLVGALLDALAGEGGSRAEFASHLREFWPGDTDIP